MTREEKYPNTKYFKYHNANPKNRLTEDCWARAISTVTGQGYNETVKAMCDEMCKSGYSLNSTKGIDKYLQSIGYIKHNQQRKANNTKLTGKEFCMKNPDITCIANIGGGHIVAIVKGVILDTWDSSEGCVGNYWTKG